MIQAFFNPPEFNASTGRQTPLLHILQPVPAIHVARKSYPSLQGDRVSQNRFPEKLSVSPLRNPTHRVRSFLLRPRRVDRHLRLLDNPYLRIPLRLRRRLLMAPILRPTDSSLLRITQERMPNRLHNFFRRLRFRRKRQPELPNTVGPLTIITDRNHTTPITQGILEKRRRDSATVLRRSRKRSAYFLQLMRP